MGQAQQCNRLVYLRRWVFGISHRFLQLNRWSDGALDSLDQSSFASFLAATESTPAAQDPPHSLNLFCESLREVSFSVTHVAVEA